MGIIDHRSVLIEKLKTGVNLFTGAGFSVLPAPNGAVLPTGKQLVQEICEKTGIPCSSNPEKLNLDLVSSRAKKKNEKEFDRLLRERFRVNDVNPLYEVLNRININAYITTNIDNIFQTVVEKDPKRYINSLFYGKAKRRGQPVYYIPLHGDVTDPNSKLFFGNLELSQASAENGNLFKLMNVEMYKYPTIFLGYAFRDSSVMTSIGDIIQEYASNIWIQFLESDRDNIDTFRDLGFNIIEDDTEGFLKELDELLPETNIVGSSNSKVEDQIWNDYKIPTSNSINTHVDAADYFKGGMMSWNVIFSGYPYKSKQVLDVHDIILNNKNTIIIGTPQSGKTTLLRQLAMSLDGNCYYIDEINGAQAEKLSNGVGDDEIIVLIDDCADDMEAFAVFANNSKLRLVGTADEYAFEAVKHLIDDITVKLYSISDLDIMEANLAYEHISPAIRNNEFTYSRNKDDKYSFWEFCIDNIRDVITEDKIKGFLASIDDMDVRELLFLTAYLTRNKSYLSTDVLWYYLDTNNYDFIKSVISQANEALSELNETIDNDLYDQDYYSLRSHIFYRMITTVGIGYYRREYGNAVKKLIQKVPRGVISRYYVFRRTAYDADLFYRLFDRTADELYDLIYSYDDNAYILQQKALYLSRCHSFGEAFSLIDKANMDMPRNYSIQNTKAIITFEANKYSDTPESRKQLCNAMAILTNCYQRDSRKNQHARRFAEYALYLNENYGDFQYLVTARNWLEMALNENSNSGSIRNCLKRVNCAIADVESQGGAQ